MMILPNIKKNEKNVKKESKIRQLNQNQKSLIHES